MSSFTIGNSQRLTIKAVQNTAAVLWTPANTTTHAWYDANDADTITESSSLISAWGDKSGNSNNLSQGVGASQPTYNASPPKVVFDGTDEIYGIFTFNIPYTIVAIMKMYTGNASLDTFVDGRTSDSIDWRRSNAADGEMHAYSGGYITQTFPFSNAENLMASMSVRASGSGTSEIWKNGNSYASASVTGTNPGGLHLGDWVGNDTRRAVVDIYEIVILSSYASDADRQKIEGYAAWKWDGIIGGSTLVTALPAGHPYKSAAPTV